VLTGGTTHNHGRLCMSSAVWSRRIVQIVIARPAGWRP
jgi:hypothetical protein